jgi:hypothetical protein
MGHIGLLSTQPGSGLIVFLGALMGDSEKLEDFTKYYLSGNRICPLPVKWDEFYTILGRPREVPPLVLSGWNFSSDRDKRNRFIEQLEYASRRGLHEAADTFLRNLKAQEWHTCEDADLDWSHGDALLEDEERRQMAVASAAKTLAPAISPSEDYRALARDNLAQMLLLYHLIFDAPDRRMHINHLKEQTEKFAHLENEEFSLMDDAEPEVAKELRDMGSAKSKELILAEILCCIDEAGLPLDRDVIEDFVDDVFNNLEA